MKLSVLQVLLGLERHFGVGVCCGKSECRVSELGCLMLRSLEQLAKC